MQEMARRIAAIFLMEPALDENYRAVKAHTYNWPKKGSGQRSRSETRVAHIGPPLMKFAKYSDTSGVAPASCRHRRMPPRRRRYDEGLSPYFANISKSGGARSLSRRAGSE